MDERAKLIAAFAEIVEEWSGKTWPGAQYRFAERFKVVSDQYEKFLIKLPVSRCPFCKTPLTMSWDPIGLDGIWWCYSHPRRGTAMPICEHFMGVLGAVTISDPPPMTPAPYTVKPGPDVPFVVPSVLTGMSRYDAWFVEQSHFPEVRRTASSRPTVRAVVSQLDVGGMAAYPIHYFGNPVTPAQPSLQTWGADDLGESSYIIALENRREQLYIKNEDCDFDLRPWLDQGFVQWIAPGDNSLTLRTSASDCAYVDLPGVRSLQYVSEGDVWSQMHPPRPMSEYGKDDDDDA